jgi:hypothetical protein
MKFMFSQRFDCYLKLKLRVVIKRLLVFVADSMKRFESLDIVWLRFL